MQIKKADQQHREQLAVSSGVSEKPSWLQDHGKGSPGHSRPSAGTAPIPLLSMEVVNSLEAYFPAGSPVVHLLKAPAALPASEAAHLSNGGRHKEGSDVMGVSVVCGCPAKFGVLH